MTLLPNRPHDGSADVAGCIPQHQLTSQFVDHPRRDGRTVLYVAVVALGAARIGASPTVHVPEEGINQ